MKKTTTLLLLLILSATIEVQSQIDSTLLSIDRIYSGEYRQDRERNIQWIENGEAYVTIEKSETTEGADELIHYKSSDQTSSTFVKAENLKINGEQLSVESFSLSPDGSNVLIFTNSSRVWRSNTKGDFYVFNLNTKSLKQLGAAFEPSSLMFTKFASDNSFVSYVHKFNIYKEDLKTGAIRQLTKDGSDGIINGTFDWVYEEEFGKRDGFAISPSDDKIAFWQLDASDTGTFYMINNTDSVYSKPVPLQYPKVGQSPSAAKLGIIDLKTNTQHWIALEGDPRQHYIPGMQWIQDDVLLIQQMNRLQNELIVWTYTTTTKALNKIYTEREETWVDLGYPDLSADGWGNNDLPLISDRTFFLRMTENDAWRHIYKVALDSGKKTLVTPTEYDIASMRTATDKSVYYMASPDNNTQRYLYTTDLKGKGKSKKLTPLEFAGLNNYNISPNGKYAIHTHESSTKVRTVRFISLPDHKALKTLVDNITYLKQLTSLVLPEVRFTKVTIEDSLDIDVRMILPIDFDESKKYPVLFHVYGEPWGQVAIDNQIGLWNTMMAQKGYVIIDMDNRGTPMLNGSAWRKSIYRQIGRVNTSDQAKAAAQILKKPYLDNNRTAVWGWSGGGSMTLNLVFKYPKIYKTGIAIAAVSNQLIYDNIYQERYMGLPQNNLEDFVQGSPITFASGLEGNLLIIHGTGDDNVHYQSAEMVVNELIKHNKLFQMMAYPNRSHGIYEGANTRKHLYNLITSYLMEHTPPNE